MMLIAALLLWPAQAILGHHGTEARTGLVVKEVVLPRPIGGSAEFQWWLNFCQGDMDRDGRTENFLRGQSIGFPGGSWDQVRDAGLLMNGLQEGKRFTYDQPTAYSSPYLLPFNWPAPTVATLASPLGPLVVGLEIHPERYVVRVLASGAYVGEFYDPPPPPGYPPLFGIRGIYRAPDVNLDGWEELYFHGTADSYAVFGLMDGATLTARWLRYEPRFSEVAPTFRPDYGTIDDLDGDLIPDFIFAYQRNDAPPVNDVIMRVVAVSGADGSRIWTKEIEPAGVCIFAGVDFTGDGLEDVLANTIYGVVALDGSDGSTLWQRDANEFRYLVPNSTVTESFGESPLVTRWPGHGVDPIGMVALRHHPPGQWTAEYLYLLLELSSGVLLEVHQLPHTLRPWAPDPTVESFFHYFCGDVDGDGFLEFARTVKMPSLDNPANPLGIPVGMVYYGPQTLFLPETVPSGALISGWVTLPAAAGCDYHLIGSLDFDALDGLRHDGVPTHFIQDRFFNQMLGRARIRGTLDANGEAHIAFPAPQSSVLIGRKILLRVLATEAGQPWRMKTMSSVATVEILP